MGLKTEWSDLDGIAIAQIGFLDGLTIDSRADSTAAVSNPPTLRSPYDQGVNRGNLRRSEAHIAAAILANNQHVVVEGAMLSSRVSVGDDEGRLTGVVRFFRFFGHVATSRALGWPASGA